MSAYLGTRGIYGCPSVTEHPWCLSSPRWRGCLCLDPPPAPLPINHALESACARDGHPDLHSGDRAGAAKATSAARRGPSRGTPGAGGCQWPRVQRRQQRCGDSRCGCARHAEGMRSGVSICVCLRVAGGVFVCGCVQGGSCASRAHL